MYILGDRVSQDPSKTKPWVLWGIIGLCVLVFLLQMLLNLIPSQYPDVSQGTLFTYTFGAIPARVIGSPLASELPPSGIPGIVTLFTSMFLHGDFWHILFNMWSLLVFGDNIEHAFGKIGFLLLYIAGGVVATLVHVVFSLKGDSLLIPTIGASGAISAVMGVYMLLYPRSQVFVLAFWIPIAMPAVVFMGIWFAMQILGIVGGGGGIAWWAHIGGFLFGIIIGLVYKILVKKPFDPNDWRNSRYLRHQPFGRNDGRADEEDIWKR
jgi:membrane associated rhomboid family serine protease